MIDHKTLSLSEQVFERLENDILSGKYQRGEYLTELMLCSDLGVSRTPVREAIRRLEQEHILETRAKGIFVIGVTDKDLKDIFNIRLKIECMAAREAAINADDEEIKNLQETLELQEFYVEKKDADHIKGFDSQFHQLIYKYSKSSALYDTLMPLHKKVQKYRKASVEDNSRAELSAKEHRGIFEAIKEHNGDLAEARMIEHIQNAAKHIIKSED